MRARLTDAEQLVAKRLWRERILAGKSREEIATEAGSTVDTVRRHECGEERIGAKQLALVTRALGVPLSFLCFPEQEVRGGAERSGHSGSVRWLATQRPLSSLSSPIFAVAWPLIRLWQEARGELSAEVREAVAAGGMWHRTILVRRSPGGARLITQHFGAGIATLTPCESLLAIDRDFPEHHRDAGYAAWVADAYAETVWRRRPRLESIRALIHMGTAATLAGRYDRLIIPWRSGSSDWFAMALSIQRAPPTRIS